MRFSLMKNRVDCPSSRKSPLPRRCGTTMTRSPTAMRSGAISARKGSELIMLDEALAEGRVAAPGEARRRHHLAVVLSGVEDARGRVLQLDEPPVGVVR
jgi:hypothetical protein